MDKGSMGGAVARVRCLVAGVVQLGVYGFLTMALIALVVTSVIVADHVLGAHLCCGTVNARQTLGVLALLAGGVS